MMIKCFELKLKLANAWHNARILADDVRKVRVDEKLQRKDVNPYFRKIHKICMN